MHYGEIKKCDIANGPGVRVSLFVSGCRNHCPGCFNKETWDFCYGKPFTTETKDHIMELLKPDYIEGFSLLGGEPFEPENQEELVRLLKEIKENYPKKNIWCKLGHGTGSTPTLMGFGQDKDKLVVITDGSKRMKLVAFWRDEIPSDAQQVAGYDKRIAGVHEVTCGLGTSTEWIQSEQSVVVGGYDAFVVNNINVTNQEINDKIIGVIAIGPIVKGPQGAECVRWNTKEKKWESKWTRSDVSSVSMIPAVSIKSEMVFVCGWNDASGWEVTGLDWKSGATRHRSILGKNNRANGAYAIIQYLANGDLLFNSVAGPIRVKY